MTSHLCGVLEETDSDKVRFHLKCLIPHSVISEFSHFKKPTNAMEHKFVYEQHMENVERMNYTIFC